MPDTEGFQKRLLLMKFKNYKISKSLRRLQLTQQTNLVNPNSGYLSW